MKIALVAINSSYTHTCLSARILRCELLKSSFEADIIETTINEKGGIISLLEKCVSKHYDAYCFSVYIWNRAEMLACAQALKELCPHSIMVMGGPELYGEEDEFFDFHPYCDYLVKGEGEEALPDLFKNLSLHKVHTIVDGGEYKDFENSDEPYVHNKFSLKSEDLQGKLVYYESSRGCPFSCSYCLSSRHCGQKRVRYKPYEKVLCELISLSELGAKTIKLVDRTFNADIKRADQIFSSLIEHHLKTNKICNYHFEICADLITDTTIEILKHAPKGLFRFEIGIQSTNKKVLENIGRHFNPKDTLEKISLLRKNTNIPLHLDLICGLPGEDLESISNAFDEVYPLADELQMGFLKVLPATKMREDAVCNGIHYLKTTPYTVICTDTMSFSDINTIRKMDKASDAFSHELYHNTKNFITDKLKSPCDFFKKLSEKAEFFELATKRRYGYLLEFIFEYFGGEINKNILRSYLLFDYLMSQQGTPPKELYEKSHEYEKQKAIWLKQIFFEETSNGKYTKNSQFENFDFPSCELYNFDFSPENTYILDRKRRIFKVLKQ